MLLTSWAIYIGIKSDIGDFQLCLINSAGQLIKTVNYSTSVQKQSSPGRNDFQICLDSKNLIHIACKLRLSDTDFGSAYLMYDNALNLLREDKFIGMQIQDIKIVKPNDGGNVEHVAIAGTISITGPNATNKLQLISYDITNTTYLTMTPKTSSTVILAAKAYILSIKLDKYGDALVTYSTDFWDAEYIVKVNNIITNGSLSPGKIMWTKTINFRPGISEEVSWVEFDQQAGVYFVAANDVNDYNKQAIYKLNSNTGNTEWSIPITYLPTEVLSIGEIKISTSGNIYYAPFVGNPTTNFIYSRVMKYEACMGRANHNIIREGAIEEVASAQAVQVYPNPFQGATHIGVNVSEAAVVSVEIYNTQGVKVETLHNGTLDAGNHNFQFSAQREGVYYLRTAIGDKTFANKLVVLGRD